MQILIVTFWVLSYQLILYGSCFAKKIKEAGLNLYVYTGFTFEELLDGANDENFWGELLKYTDFLVDGKFEEDKKHYTLLFKGSENQRIIDVQKSLQSNKVVILIDD